MAAAGETLPQNSLSPLAGRGQGEGRAIISARISVSQIFLSIAVLLLFLAVLLNLICAWQSPKWKFAVRTAQISNGKRMMWDLEISSWLSFTSFLAGLVFAVIGNL